MSRDRLPPSLGGGGISGNAMKLMQRPEFKGVGQPEFIAECVVRVLTKKDERARSGLRAVVKYYEEGNRFGKLTRFLRKVIDR